MNLHAIRAIYGFELHRTWRTVFKSIYYVSSSSLYRIRGVEIPVTKRLGAVS